jgi:protein MpaA
MTRHGTRLLPLTALCVVTLTVTAAPAPAAPASAAAVTAVSAAPAERLGGRPAVIGSRTIGHTVRDRPIRAWHLGDPQARETVVAIGSMHGDEQQAARPLRHLRDHRPISGVNLWVVPVMNPDGYARNDRQNAHGVDLNRNFPVHWIDQDGEEESGPRPASEPETSAMMGFLRAIDPDHVVSLHQPLRGIDPRTKNPHFARRLAREMFLPIRHIDCGGVCHGTMTQWFNARLDGDAITAELAAHPSRRYLTRIGPNGLLRAIGGSR